MKKFLTKKFIGAIILSAIAIIAQDAWTYRLCACAWLLAIGGSDVTKFVLKNFQKP